MALYRSGQTNVERVLRELQRSQRDELLNETRFFTVRQAHMILARWVEDYNTERPHSSLGYATPVAFAAELEK